MQLEGARLHIQRQTRRVTRWWTGSADTSSGATIATLFHRALALLLLVNWISLGSQVHLLLGADGLGPALTANAGPLTCAPDLVLFSLCTLGAILALLGLVGVKPRLTLALQLALYLAHTSSGGELMAQRADALVLETMLLALFLPRGRKVAWAHTLMRLFMFKVYFFSGLEKLMSADGSWLNGYAMELYFESPALPTRVGWLFSQSPLWWHHIETWAVLFIQVVVPWAIFGPRGLRRIAFLLLSGHQMLILATANEGVFSPLLLTLHLFLLDDALVRLGGVWVRRHTRRGTAQLADWFERGETYADDSASRRHNRARWTAFVVFGCFVVLSGLQELSRLNLMPGLASASWSMVRDSQLINSYSLLMPLREHHTQAQIEVRVAGDWRPLALGSAPGPIQRAPGWIAPHQPRIDRTIAGYQPPTSPSARPPLPAWLQRLRAGLCNPGTPLRQAFELFPRGQVQAVRFSWWRYDFSSARQLEQTGAWWQRKLLNNGDEYPCPP